MEGGEGDWVNSPSLDSKRAPFLSGRHLQAEAMFLLRVTSGSRTEPRSESGRNLTMTRARHDLADVERRVLPSRREIHDLRAPGGKAKIG